MADKMGDMPVKYQTSCSAEWQHPSHIGHLSLPVLQFLWGQPWDDFAINFVQSLRPSCIRAVTGPETTDARLYRVTVHVKDGVIQDIEQEVEVGLEGGYQHGHALWVEAKRRGLSL